MTNHVGHFITCRISNLSRSRRPSREVTRSMGL